MIQGLEEAGFDPTSKRTGAQRTEVLGVGLPNRLKSTSLQIQEQAETNFVTAVLRRQSGAAISPSELKLDREKYFPQPGDSPEVVKNKKALRLLAINGFKQEAGPAWEKSAPPPEARIAQAPASRHPAKPSVPGPSKALLAYRAKYPNGAPAKAPAASGVPQGPGISDILPPNASTQSEEQ